MCELKPSVNSTSISTIWCRIQLSPLARGLLKVIHLKSNEVAETSLNLKEEKQEHSPITSTDCIYLLMVNGLHLSSAFLHITIYASHSHIHTPTAIGCHARFRPACQEQSGVGVLLRDTSTHPGWD